jgi:hypothetical protein
MLLTLHTNGSESIAYPGITELQLFKIASNKMDDVVGDSFPGDTGGEWSRVFGTPPAECPAPDMKLHPKQLNFLIFDKLCICLSPTR